MACKVPLAISSWPGTVGRSKQAHFQLPAKDRYFSRIHFLVEVNPPHCLVRAVLDYGDDGVDPELLHEVNCLKVVAVMADGVVPLDVTEMGMAGRRECCRSKRGPSLSRCLTAKSKGTTALASVSRSCWCIM